MTNTISSEINQLVIAISSRALFDMKESHEVYMEKGLEAYQKYQIEHEDEPLERGVAFNLVQKLLNLNRLLKQDVVEVILLSRNSADTGLRVFNSIKHYGLGITRAAFSGGDIPHRYISAFNGHLFLSVDGADVRQALELGIAAATIMPSKKNLASEETVKIAFDGDAVLFSDESEQIYKAQGLEAFTKNEVTRGGFIESFLASIREKMNAGKR